MVGDTDTCNLLTYQQACGWLQQRMPIECMLGLLLP
jgi:hypothetical protein